MTNEPVERHLSESRTLAAEPSTVYDAVSDLGRMGSRSPEHVGSWQLFRGEPRPGGWFVGLNRNGWRVWPTTGRVVAAEPGRRFVFESSVLGLPIARWGYLFEPAPDGNTVVTETWDDLRAGNRSGAVVAWLGAAVAGTPGQARVDRNREGIHQTLDRLAAEVERPGSGTTGTT